MSDQLSFSLGLDASPMMQSATTATKELESKFKQASDGIREEFGKPITIQAEFDLSGDPSKKYNEIVKSQRKIRDEQAKVNETTRQTAKLNDLVTKAAKGTNKEKKAALKTVEKLLQNTKKTREEMILLEGAARKLKNALPKESDMNFASKGGGLGFKQLTAAGITANLATKAVEGLVKAIEAAVTTGMKMQSLNLQMEAFAGGAAEADQAMQAFSDIAAKSPLDVMGVAEAGKIMMAFGVETDAAVEATERLAVVSAATGADINLLARNMGQVQAQGRAYTRDLTQFAIQGIPIWDELAKVTGKTATELKGMARDGEIGMHAVTQALRNMTAEGTAFAEVADRMQETYAGKLAKLQSDFQMAAGSIIEDINRIDDSIGASDNITKFLNSFNVGLGGVAKGMEDSAYSAAIMSESTAKLTDEIKDADSAAAGWWGKLTSIPGFADPFKSAAGTIAQVGRETDGARIAAEQYGVSMTNLTIKLNELRQSGDFGKQLVQNFQGLAQEAGFASQGIDDQISKYMELGGVTNEYLEKRKAQYEEEKTAAEAALTDIELKYNELAAGVEESYAEIESAANKSIEHSDKIIAKLQEQVDATRELGPAGSELADIRRRELEYTAKTGKELTGHITKEGKRALEAQATLERMDAQAQAAELQKQIIKEQLKQADQKKKLQEAEKERQDKLLEIEGEKKTAMENQTVVIEDLGGKIQDLTDILGGQLQGNWEVIEGLVDDTEGETKDLTDATGVYAKSINDAIKNYDTVIKRLDTIKKKILTMPKIPAAPATRFAGGPVSGGSSYTVNELGKEAFLSASGKLSMINAPAWGEWKAPSSGTIIPAHLTKQLDIPTGEINVNKRTSSSASATGGTDMNRLVRSIAGAMGGDSITNNVTIQSANTTQTASDVLVQLAKLKRLRNH